MKIPKQDRSSVRTPGQLEQKYNLGGMSSGTDLKTSAQVSELVKSFNEYVVRTNAIIASLVAQNEAQNITVETSGKKISLSDSTRHGLAQLIVYGKVSQEAGASTSSPKPLIIAGEGGRINITISDGEKEQLFSVITPDGLLAIPVDEGGNYIDSAGQAWVCDEMNYAERVYIRRVGWIESYAGEDIGDVFISSTGEKSTGAEIIYPLPEPVFFDLAREELEGFAALYTYHLNTSLQNDAECDMTIGYVADTKAYIDKSCEGR